MSVRPFYSCTVLFTLLACVLIRVHSAAAIDGPEAAPLLPSEYSELLYVYESLRMASRRGDLPSYREMYDPATLQEVYTDAEGNTQRLTRRWLRRHAREWPDVDRWEFAQAVGVDGWARLVFRHPHLTRRRPDGRWDFYFLVFRRVDDTWLFTRRAIGTFGTLGPPAPPPQVADIRLLPSLEVPTAAPVGATTALGE